MQFLTTHFYVQALINLCDNKHIGVYVQRKGDMDRGCVIIKSYSDSISDDISVYSPDFLYDIHYRQYDFQSDAYIWQSTKGMLSHQADSVLEKMIAQDGDCWCIDVESPYNIFADIL